MNIFLLIFMIIYLFTQSMFDIFNHHMVPRYFNNIAVFITGGGYLYKCVVTKTCPDIVMFFLLFGIWFISVVLHIFSNGDRKAYYAIAFYFALFGKDLPQTEACMVIWSYIIGVVVFNLVNIKQLILTIKTKQKKKMAFFPYILLGFISTVVIGGLSYGRI